MKITVAVAHESQYAQWSVVGIFETMEAAELYYTKKIGFAPVSRLKEEVKFWRASTKIAELVPQPISENFTLVIFEMPFGVDVTEFFREHFVCEGLSEQCVKYYGDDEESDVEESDDDEDEIVIAQLFQSTVQLKCKYYNKENKILIITNCTQEPFLIMENDVEPQEKSYLVVGKLVGNKVEDLTEDDKKIAYSFDMAVGTWPENLPREGPEVSTKPRKEINVKGYDLSNAIYVTLDHGQILIQHQDDDFVTIGKLVGDDIVDLTEEDKSTAIGLTFKIGPYSPQYKK